MTGAREPSTDGNLLCNDLNEACASASLRCDDTCTRKLPPPLLTGALGATCVGLVVATRTGGSAAAGASDCGASDNGAWAFAALGLEPAVRVFGAAPRDAGAGFAAAAGGATPAGL